MLCVKNLMTDVTLFKDQITSLGMAWTWLEYVILNSVPEQASWKDRTRRRSFPLMLKIIHAKGKIC